MLRWCINTEAAEPTCNVHYLPFVRRVCVRFNAKYLGNYGLGVRLLLGAYRKVGGQNRSARPDDVTALAVVRRERTHSMVDDVDSPGNSPGAAAPGTIILSIHHSPNSNTLVQPRG